MSIPADWPSSLPSPQTKPPDRPVWPAVIGILSMVFGGMSICAFGGPLRSFALRAALSGRYLQVGNHRLALAYVACSTWVSVLAIVAGWLLFRHRRISRTLYFIWVPLDIVCSLAYIYVSDEVLEPFQTLRYSLPAAIVSIGLNVIIVIWLVAPKHRKHMRAWRSPKGRANSKPTGPIWPTVLGVLAVVMAAEGLAVIVGYYAVGPFQEPPLWWLSEQQKGMALAAMIAWACCFALQLTAGILLLRRRRATAICHGIFAALYGILIVINPCLSILLAPDFPALRDKLGLLGMLPYVAIGVAWKIPFLVYPIFLLIWFNRRTIRQQVRQWSAARSLWRA